MLFFYFILLVTLVEHEFTILDLLRIKEDNDTVLREGLGTVFVVNTTFL